MRWLLALAIVLSLSLPVVAVDDDRLDRLERQVAELQEDVQDLLSLFWSLVTGGHVTRPEAPLISPPPPVQQGEWVAIGHGVEVSRVRVDAGEIPGLRRVTGMIRHAWPETVRVHMHFTAFDSIGEVLVVDTAVYADQIPPGQETSFADHLLPFDLGAMARWDLRALAR